MWFQNRRAKWRKKERQTFNQVTTSPVQRSPTEIAGSVSLINSIEHQQQLTETVTRIDSPLTSRSIGTTPPSVLTSPTTIQMPQLINMPQPLQLAMPNQTNWQNLLSSPTLTCIRTAGGGFVIQPQLAAALQGGGVTLGGANIGGMPTLIQSPVTSLAGGAGLIGGRMSAIPQILSLAQIPTSLQSGFSNGGKEFGGQLPLIAIQIPSTTT